MSIHLAQRDRLTKRNPIFLRGNILDSEKNRWSHGGLQYLINDYQSTLD